MKMRLVFMIRFLTLNPHSSNAMGRKGLNLYDLGRLEEAISYFDKVLDVDSNNSAALYYKALALDKLVYMLMLLTFVIRS